MKQEKKMIKIAMVQRIRKKNKRNLEIFVLVNKWSINVKFSMLIKYGLTLIVKAKELKNENSDLTILLNDI